MLAGLASRAKWEFSVLPQAETDLELPARLPGRLRDLLHLQPAFLRQLTLVKLTIAARAYLKLYPNDSNSFSEEELCNLMQDAIRVCPWPVLPGRCRLCKRIVWIVKDDACMLFLGRGLCLRLSCRSLSCCTYCCRS